jgi:hypothetical protein
MSTKDFKQIENNVGGLLSFTSFLSTGKSKDIALMFIGPSGRKTALQLIYHLIQVLHIQI